MRITSLFSMNLSRLFHCSVIKVLCSLSLRQLLYFIKSICLCQQLFYFSSLSFQATTCLSYHQRSALSTTFFFPSRSFSRTDCRIPCRLLSLLFFCMCRIPSCRRTSRLLRSLNHYLIQCRWRASFLPLQCIGLLLPQRPCPSKAEASDRLQAHRPAPF